MRQVKLSDENIVKLKGFTGKTMNDRLSCFFEHYNIACDKIVDKHNSVDQLSGLVDQLRSTVDQQRMEIDKLCAVVDRESTNKSLQSTSVDISQNHPTYDEVQDMIERAIDNAKRGY